MAKYGQTCTEDRHCTDPFNACIAGTCQCSPGTTRDIIKGICYAGKLGFYFKYQFFFPAVCPDGMHPRQTCRRLFINDVDMLESAANTDSCPLGYRCVTYGSPYVGHCCRLRCPYGEPDLSQSCDVGAPMDSKCRPLTHFCYTITEPGYAKRFSSALKASVDWDKPTNELQMEIVALLPKALPRPNSSVHQRSVPLDRS